jgi:cation:H+ antiporter
MVINVILFAVGLFMLIKGGDWFVDGAAGVARRFHLPELLIGATVVSIGTTLPEVMVSAQGAIAGSGAMAYGNAIGSIICNTSLIAALTIAIKPAKTERKALVLPIAFFFVSVAFYVFVAYFFGEFARWVGITLLCIFIIYMISTVLQMKKTPSNEIDGIVEDTDNAHEISEEIKHISYPALAIEALVVLVGGGIMIYRGGVFRWIAIAMIAVFAVYAILSVVRKVTKKKPFEMLNEIFYMIIGAAVIAGGANLLVDSGTEIASALGVPQTVIALTFVALGTSLPELVTAITSLAKGHGALSLGNIIGANLFNLVLVSGVSTAISPFAVPAESQIMGLPASLVLDIPVMLGVMLILTVPTLIGKRLYRAQGIILLCIYAAFCTLQFVM